MKITADTNLLVRAVVRDHEGQARTAARVLRDSETIAISTTSLCEFVWVLRSVYRFASDDISRATRVLLNAVNVVVDGPAVEAGLAILDAGGDFADGVIAHQGVWLGGEAFVSFDRKAVAIMAAAGHSTELLSA